VVGQIAGGIGTLSRQADLTEKPAAFAAYRTITAIAGRNIVFTIVLW
jgi:hypothetical protein